jgi:hypothetical protein
MSPTSDDEKAAGLPPGEETDANTIVGDKETAVESRPTRSEKKMGDVNDQEKGQGSESQDEDFDIEVQEASKTFTQLDLSIRGVL